ncbi:MAG: glycerate kinase family protein [Solirubrobacteraceae bacterium]
MDRGLASHGARTALIAPDKFKGTLSAAEVAEPLARGFASRGWRARCLPVADGGEGTAEALLRARGGRLVSVRASDALGRPVQASFALLADGRTAALDAAAASGLALIPEHERDAIAASSRGTGELIAAAMRAGARTVIVAAGGTASTDGGRGAIEALARLPSLPRLIVACDVQTPWELAAEVFAPQKGASPSQVRALSARLSALAESAPRDPRGMPMGGCAGGLSGGLWAWCGAELAPGAELVLDELSFEKRLAGAGLVVTGEGRIDVQTLAGKAVSAVARRSAAAGVPCVAVVGVNRLRDGERARLGLAAVLEAGSAAALEAAARRLASSGIPRQ